MAYLLRFVVILILVLSYTSVQCTEFVPVYMWGTQKLSEHVPALHKISQDSFKDTLLEYLKKDPFVIVFAERTLSPEDFAQRNPKGDSAFLNIQKLKEQGNFVSYISSVQNPIPVIKELKPVTQTSIQSILSSSVPKENIWIINLDDARDVESRFHMLKHSDIAQIYGDVLKKHDNVLALYTANHTAWVAPEDFTRSRSRNLLADEDSEQDTHIQWGGANEGLLLYVTAPGIYNESSVTTNIDKTFILKNVVKTNGSSLTADLVGTKTFSFNFTLDNTGYWYLNSIKVDNKDLIIGSIFAPNRFSYHCTTSTFTEKNSTLSLPGFQVQPFWGEDNGTRFGDAYDCVGFTSVPIWSGLFVTALFLLIVTSGLTMMIDIKTMDRFDDPKGKTITVNASE